MKLIRYNRPKLPRNKFGINAKNGFFAGGVATEDGSLNIKYDDGYTSTETQPVTPEVIQAEGEWYNLQTKIYHSYKDVKDANGDKVYINQYDSKGQLMYDKEGKAIMVVQQECIGSTWITTIENYRGTSGLKNTDMYRMVLLRFRKNHREGKRWRIPMLSTKYTRTGDAVQNVNMTIEERDTWWPIQGGETKWWNKSNVEYTTTVDGKLTTQYRGKTYEDVLPVKPENIKMKTCYRYQTILQNGYNHVVKVLGERPTFKNSGSDKMLVGCAIFKYTGKGAFGWQRVSNIATVLLRLDNKGNIQLEANQTN